MNKLTESNVMTGVDSDEGCVSLCIKKADGEFEVYRLTSHCADTLSRSLAFQAREVDAHWTICGVEDAANDIRIK